MSINTKKIDEILKKFDIKIANYKHYEIAFTHSSYSNEHNTVDNERIEYLGDAVFGMLVANYIYQNFEDLTEGQMSKLRATYVCEEANFKYAKELKLDEIILLGKGEEKSGGRTRQSLVADVFETFLAATYLTCGLEAVDKVLQKVVYPHILKIDEKQFIDYKSDLQELVQADTRKHLEYRLITQEGAPHQRTFTIGVFVDNISYGIGKGSRKKDAEQQAAKEALKKMAI